MGTLPPGSRQFFARASPALCSVIWNPLSSLIPRPPLYSNIVSPSEPLRSLEGNSEVVSVASLGPGGTNGLTNEQRRVGALPRNELLRASAPHLCCVQIAV